MRDALPEAADRTRLKTRARVVALGQTVAGDDGVGPAVLAQLRGFAATGRLPPGVELIAAADASALIELLCCAEPVILIDAATGRVPGRVLCLDSAELQASGVRPLSSHGIDAVAAIGLVQALHPECAARTIRIVAVTIATPVRLSEGLSAPVAAAIAAAAGQVVSLIEG